MARAVCPRRAILYRTSAMQCIILVGRAAGKNGAALMGKQPDEQPKIAQPHAHQALETAYPITLTNLSGVLVVVVGGGAVGERKLRGLLAVGAAVRLISPTATPELRGLANNGAITWYARPY